MNLIFRVSIQEENPARERTIVRTATKLQPFSFNHSDALSPTLKGVKRSDDVKADLLCPLCCLPLNPIECIQVRATKLMGQGSENLLASNFLKSCCASCQLQNFGEVDTTYSLLPQLIKRSEAINPEMKEAWMRYLGYLTIHRCLYELCICCWLLCAWDFVFLSLFIFFFLYFPKCSSIFYTSSATRT